MVYGNTTTPFRIPGQGPRQGEVLHTRPAPSSSGRGGVCSGEEDSLLTGRGLDEGGLGAIRAASAPALTLTNPPRLSTTRAASPALRSPQPPSTAHPRGRPTPPRPQQRLENAPCPAAEPPLHRQSFTCAARETETGPEAPSLSTGAPD